MMTSHLVLRSLRLSTLLALWAAGASTVLAQQPEPGEPAGHVQRTPVLATLNGFVENGGQWADEVLFVARRGGIEATLESDAMVFRPMPDLEARDVLPVRPLVLRLPSPAAAVGKGALPTQHHFFVGNRTATHVLGYQQVVYEDVVPGLDIVVRNGAEGFAYDLSLEPGVELGDLVLGIEGADSLELINDTVLVMHTPAGPVEQRIGASWQVESGTGNRTPVASRFRIPPSVGGMLSIGFEAPGRDPAAAFVLDPSLVYSTYVGGTGQDQLADSQVMPDGSVYLTARAYANAPTTAGAFQPLVAGQYDAWVGKLSPDGSMLEWGTFLGGTFTEEPFGVHVDVDGTVVVAGNTYSDFDLGTCDFPTTPGSLQPDFAGQNQDLFITRLAADGSALVWSTYYGGPDYETALTSALFPSGDVLIAARPFTALPPATPGAFDTVFHADKSILIRISADGTELVWQTYFASGVTDLLIDADANIYFCGLALSAFPATPGAFKEALSPGDPSAPFVAKLGGDGTQLFWATYLGGSSNSENILGITLDAAGAVYAVGFSNATDFPVTPGAFDVSSPSGSRGFLAKLLPGGAGLVWATYLTACCSGTYIWDVAVDSAGNAIAVGSSNKPTFPTTPDAFQPSFGGGFPSSDAHLTKMNAFGDALIYSTYFGGSSSDSAKSVGLDADQNPYISVASGGLTPVTPGSYDTTYNGGGDMVVAKFSLGLHPWKVMGNGLTGALDIPNLAGGGLLAAGTPARFAVRGAPPAAQALLVVGLAEGNLAFKGGTMVPAPHLMLALGSNGQGALDLSFTWLHVPAGITLYTQFWFKDPGAEQGFSATNALQMIAQ